MIPQFIKWPSKIILLLGLSACTNWLQLDFWLPPEPVTPTMIRQQFRVGDMITVYTLDQTVYEFPLVEVNDTAIVGQRQQIPFNEIDKVKPALK
jgi:hypothetical protein